MTGFGYASTEFKTVKRKKTRSDRRKSSQNISENVLTRFLLVYRHLHLVV